MLSAPNLDELRLRCEATNLKAKHRILAMLTQNVPAAWIARGLLVLAVLLVLLVLLAHEAASRVAARPREAMQPDSDPVWMFFARYFDCHESGWMPKLKLSVGS